MFCILLVDFSFLFTAKFGTGSANIEGAGENLCTRLKRVGLIAGLGGEQFSRTERRVTSACFNAIRRCVSLMEI